jgi:hypothetical protein
MTVIARWWCCAEYARTGAQHQEACEYALLGERADVLVQVKADYARLAHQLRGAVEAGNALYAVLDGVWSGKDGGYDQVEVEAVMRQWLDTTLGGQ